MAIYTDATISGGAHGIWQSSLLKSTLAGHLWDVLTVAESGSGANFTRTEIDVDNGVAVKVGDFTGNGLQERYATIASVGDKIGVTATPAVVKDAFTRAQADETNFYNKAGHDAKVYEVVGDEYDPDIFGVGLHQFTAASQANVKKGAYVVVNGSGQWVAQAAKPSSATYGFIGQVHSLHVGLYYTVVRIAALKNEAVG